MERCLVCRKGNIHEKKAEYTQKVAGYTLKAPITAHICDHCQDTGYPVTELSRATLCMAAELARAGFVDREGFRFMRDALGLRVADLAQLLGVAPNSVTRWETGNRALDTSAAAILAQMVLDAVGEPYEMRDTLQAIQAPHKLSKTKGVLVRTENPYQYAAERMKQALLYLTSLSATGEERLRWALDEFVKIDDNNFPKEERALFFGKISSVIEQVRARLKEKKASVVELLPKMTKSEQDQLLHELIVAAQEVGFVAPRSHPVRHKPAA